MDDFEILRIVNEIEAREEILGKTLGLEYMSEGGYHFYQQLIPEVKCLLLDLKNKDILINQLREKIKCQAEKIEQLEKSRVSLRRNNAFLQQKIFSLQKGIKKLRKVLMYGKEE